MGFHRYMIWQHPVLEFCWMSMKLRFTFMSLRFWVICLPSQTVCQYMLYCFFLTTVITSACDMFSYFVKSTDQSSVSKNKSGCDCLNFSFPSCTPHFSFFPLYSVKPESFSLFFPMLFPPFLQSVFYNGNQSPLLKFNILSPEFCLQVH